ncbi:MAG: O-sialoglycoprotein endopeptidase [Clostridia bacterium]|nr:O-sialoglycoprotein endopeptidase [Clostridia bacterium]
MGTALGFDTSCYTTSVALARDGEIIASRRRLLTVEAGGRGLMQSEGVFQHETRLPGLIEELMQEAGVVRLDAIGASTRPRPVDGSYMPVFTVGEGYGRSLAAVLGVPFIATSHQEGHIRAAMVDTGLEYGEEILAVHLSGGTTEVLHVKKRETGSETENTQNTIEIIGGSNDLHAGQFVDRVGVRLGLGFPAGPALEQMAMRGTAEARLPVWVRGCECSFSGSESAAQRLIDAGGISPDDMAAEVFSCIARSLAKVLANAAEQTGVRKVLLAGGVASSTHLRKLLPERLKKMKVRMKLYWGRPELSGDNACGVALIASETEGK